MSGGLPTDAEFAVTPDPKRFLLERMPDILERMPDIKAIATLVTIADWFDDLRRRAPVQK